ncbi:MAG: carboxylase [Spirochaetes bacterium]|nr:carboxylase [Spirochaetota bacterium]
MSKRSIKIKNLDLRDGHQSYFATRMTTDQILSVLPMYMDVGYHALEVWGGATLDSAMRFLNENPWVRLEKISKIANGKIELTALARGINLFGYNPYPDEVVFEFNKLAVETGITIMRIFDALNDLNNLKVTIKAVKEAGGKADGAICYTTDPDLSVIDNADEFKDIPEAVFNVDYFVNKAVELEKMGADIITIKDMAGLIDPEMSFKLITALKQNIKVPVGLHSHCTPGYAVTSLVAAMLAGVDILDTVSYPFSGGPSHPATEIIHEFAKKLDIDTGLDENKFAEIRAKLIEIRNELAEHDGYKEYKNEFSGTFTDKQHDLMDKAIDYIKNNDFDNALNSVHELEADLGLPEPDEAVRLAQIPGGMYSNMVSQLKQLKLDEHFDEVLKEVPKVRINAGMVPLVTPTSQIVGVQAVQNVMLRSKGKEEYSRNSTQYINLVKGEYGETPVPVSPEFREKITGSKEEKRFDTSKWKHTEAPEGLVKDKKDQMLLDLFPPVAKKFLEERNKKI